MVEGVLAWERAALVARPVELARCPVLEPVVPGDLPVVLAVDPVLGPDEQVPDFKAWEDTGR